MTITINGTTGISGVDGSAGTPAVQGTDTNTGVFYPAADTVGVSTGGSERVRVDSSGNVGIGTTNIPSNKDTVTPKLIVNGAGLAGSMQVVRNTTVGAGGAILELTATRGSDVNSYTILQSGDGVGSVVFGGSDGTQFTPAASVGSQVDGTPGANDMPGRLIFSTTADGASSVTERMRIDSSGNVGIGTSSPAVKLDVNGITGWSGATTGQTAQIVGASSGIGGGGNFRVLSNTTQAVDVGGVLTLGGYYTTTTASVDFASILGAKENSTGGNTAGYLAFGTRPNAGNMTERMRIDSSGNLLFNSGYGSVATAYGCRAWVNFNGTGTVAIRASGNVTSITDNNVGDYTVNFTTAMPDVNYTTIGMCSDLVYGSSTYLEGTTYSTTAVRILTRSGYTATPATGDPTIACLSIFR